MKQDSQLTNAKKRKYALAGSPEELRMVQLGKERYAKTEAQSGDMTPPKRILVGKNVHKFGANLRAWVKHTVSNKRPSLGGGYALLLAEALDVCGDDVVALVAGQAIIEAATGMTTATSAGISAARAVEMELKGKLFAKENPYMFLYSDSMSESRRFMGARKYSELMRLVKTEQCSPNSLFLNDYSWATQAKAHLGLVMLHLFRAATGYIDIKNVMEPGRRNLIAKVSLTASFLSNTEDLKEILELSRPVLLPITTQPKNWCLHQPEIGGYEARFVGLVKPGRNPEAYDKEGLYTGHYGTVLYALNRLQATAYEINPGVKGAATFFRLNPDKLNGVPEDVCPPQSVRMPLRQDYPDRRSFGFHKARWAVTEERNSTLRVRFHRTLTLAGEVDYSTDYGKRPFYFPCHLDYRSRMYPAASNMFNFQGSDLSRGLLQYHAGEVLNFHGKTELKLHGANMFGLSRVTEEHKLQWVDLHEAEIMASAEAPITNRFWAEADKPWQFLAFCKDYRTSTLYGSPSRCICTADASASGFQLMSLLTGDEKLAKLTNLIPSEERHDLYDYITSLVLPEVVSQQERWPSLKFILDRGLTRDLVKGPVMGIPYGITVVGMSRIIGDMMLDWLQRKAPPTLKDTERYIDGSARLTTIIYNTVFSEFPKLRTLLSALRLTASLRIGAGKGLEWTTPSGFPWRQAIREQTTTIIRPTIAPGTRVWADIMENTEKLDVRKNVMAVTPNFIHSLDAAVMHHAIWAMPTNAPITTIHDCIGTQANHMPAFKNAYKTSLTQMFLGKNLLHSFLQSNLEGDKLRAVMSVADELEPMSPKVVDGIRNSKYCIN